MATNYNLSPKPLYPGYRTAYGQVPGNLEKPPSLYEGVQSVYPGISGMTSDAGRVIGSQIRGELSPETINTIQDEAASFGVTSGLPQTNFAGYRGLRNLGLNVEGTQRAGVDAYNKYLSTLAPVMDNPELMTGIASWNATNNAAPDPMMAYNQLLADYGKYMGGAAGAGSVARPAGGTAPTPIQDVYSSGMPVFNSLATDYNWGSQGAPGAYQRWQDEVNSWFKPGAGTDTGNAVSSLEGDFGQDWFGGGDYNFEALV